MSDAKSIQVHYFALLREQRGREVEVVSTSASTPAQLYEQLQAAHGLSLPGGLLRVAVNDRYADMQGPLHEGDRVVFIQPVAGG